MGRRLDSLLGRSFRTSKLKALLGLAVSRVAVLNNHHEVRCSHARKDVAQLLHLGQQGRALLRVEHVIKAQNMLDVLVMVESYCDLLSERMTLLKTEKDCPPELKEAISSLIYVASRCGDFPELQEIRYFFSARYGREFAAAAVELRNSCGVNPKMIQKLSTKQPSLESRQKALKEIAAEIGVAIRIQDRDPTMEESTEIIGPARSPLRTRSEGTIFYKTAEDRLQSAHSLNELNHEQEFSGSVKANKYTDVSSAAQAAYESAAYAAAAARAAFELSKPGYGERGLSDWSSPSSLPRDGNSSVTSDGLSIEWCNNGENSGGKSFFGREQVSRISVGGLYGTYVNGDTVRTASHGKTNLFSPCSEGSLRTEESSVKTEARGRGSVEVMDGQSRPVAKEEDEESIGKQSFQGTEDDLLEDGNRLSDRTACLFKQTTLEASINNGARSCENGGSNLQSKWTSPPISPSDSLNSFENEFGKFELTSDSKEQRLDQKLVGPSYEQREDASRKPLKPVSVRTRRLF